MKKLFKTLLAIVLVLILLFIIAGVCLLLFLDPNKFKGQISAMVHDKTGRELVINGNIERSFFPWLGLRVHDVRMSNAPGFEPQDNFVTVGEADVSVRLLSLLSGKIEVGKLALKDMQLNLAQNTQGQTNWHDFTKTKTATTNPAASATAVNTNSVPAAHKLTQFNIEAIDIHNAHITWVDKKNNRNLELTGLDLSSENIGFNKTFPLSLKFVLRSNKPKLAGEFSLDSNVLLAPQNYRLGKLRIKVGLLDKPLPKAQLQAESVIVDLKQQTLSIANALVSAANLTAKANLEGMQILDKPHFNGHIDITQLNLKDLLKAFGKTINTQDPAALQKMALSANFIADTSSATLSSVVGHLDDSTIQGNINFSNFANNAINFAITIDQLNLDRYMPAKSATVAVTSGAGTPGAGMGAVTSNKLAQSSKTGKFDVLKQANVDGTLKIGTLIVSKTQLNQVTAQLLIKNGMVTLDPLTAAIYQGMSQSQITADLRGSVPHLTIDEKLSGVQINQLIKSERLTGTANITAHLTMQGEGQNEILRSLNGNLQFNIQNGALLGVDLPYELNRAAAIIKKQPGPTQASTGRTDFKQFSGSGVFQNGVFSNNDLLMQSAELKITGSGTANLVTKGLNYHLNAEQPDNPVLKNTPLPLLITGTFSKPIITPDIEAVIRTLLKSGIKTRLEERLDGAGFGGRTGEAAGALLNRFLQR